MLFVDSDDVTVNAQMNAPSSRYIQTEILNHSQIV